MEDAVVVDLKTMRTLGTTLVVEEEVVASIPDEEDRETEQTLEIKENDTRVAAVITEVRVARHRTTLDGLRPCACLTLYFWFVVQVLVETAAAS